MYWKQQENNAKNCNNIDLKCLMDLASRMEFSKNTWSFLFCKKILLSCFYLQLSLMIISTIINLWYLVKYCR